MKKIIGLFRRQGYLLTAVLMFLSFPSYDFILLKGFPLFAWISLVPLFLFTRGKTVREVLYYAFVTGLAGHFLVYNWIGDFGGFVPGGNAVILGFVLPTLSVYFASKMVIAEYLSQRFESLRFLIFPSAWILIDFVQSIGFLAFPWTYWGYSQYPFTSFIQIASIVGILGVNFIMIMGNALVSDLVRSLLGVKIREEGRVLVRTAPVVRFAVFLLFLVCTVVFGVIFLQHRTPLKKDMRVASIQTCISPWENWNFNRFRYLEYLEYYTRQALTENPDFLIWSESATLERISWNYERGTPDPFEREVLAIARRSGKPLLTGEIGVIEDGLNRRLYPQNSAVLINGNGDVAGTYPKINLVPFGEWFPYEKWLPFVKQIAVDMGGSNFVPGDRPILFDVGNRKMAVLICYEGIFYSLCRDYRNMGAEFFVNITNLQWTHTYCGPMQQFGASVFRAVENGIWFVSASNSGYTALIDPCGRVVRSIPRESRGYLIGNMDFGLNRRTVYSRCGDVILYLAAAFLLVLCGGTAVSSRRRKK